MACRAPVLLGRLARRASQGRRGPLVPQGRKVPKRNRVNQDHKEAKDRLAQQGRRVLQAQQDFVAQTALLVFEAQMAWLDLWARPVLLASADLRASQDRQARTARLVRRGIPESLARRALRVL